MTMEFIAPTKTPLETLLTLRPFQVIEFLDGISSIRNVLASRNHADSTVITPLRGALPLLWAAEGVEGLEASLPLTTHEIPLGLFHYVDRNGNVKTTSPTYEQKTGLLHAMLENLSEAPVKRLLLLDEVQKGGTLSAATRILRAALEEQYPASKLSVVAAQDSRMPIVRQPKTALYERIASNSFDSVRTNVIPMPLIATDRAALLDTVLLQGYYHDTHLAPERFTVVRNVRSKSLFRALGTLARIPEIRHDENFVAGVVEEQGNLTESSAGKVEFWLPKFIGYLDGR